MPVTHTASRYLRSDNADVSQSSCPRQHVSMSARRTRCRGFPAGEETVSEGIARICTEGSSPHGTQPPATRFVTRSKLYRCDGKS